MEGTTHTSSPNQTTQCTYDSIVWYVNNVHTGHTSIKVPPVSLLISFSFIDNLVFVYLTRSQNMEVTVRMTMAKI